MRMKELVVVTNHMDEPFDRLHHVCLLYVGGEINKLTLATLLFSLFAEGQPWLLGNSLERFARRITQRD